MSSFNFQKLKKKCLYKMKVKQKACNENQQSPVYFPHLQETLIASVFAFSSDCSHITWFVDKSTYLYIQNNKI